jgi:DNA (cytosine-5)-methyltransferase 1
MRPHVEAVDLFCGAGGLTHGLRQAGIDVVAGVDLDPRCRHAFEANNPPAAFHAADIQKMESDEIAGLYKGASRRILAGCAPCQPFSNYTQGQGRHEKWGLLFSLLQHVEAIRPDVVVMENVPELRLRGRRVLDRFSRGLIAAGYHIASDVVDCSEYGVPQSRRRLVLMASRLGPISLPPPETDQPVTVRRAIGHLSALEAGQCHPTDPAHVAAKLSPLNLERIRATPHDGGSRDSWPERLLSECHKRPSGTKYIATYGRMHWDKPAPTMTTWCTNYGSGRFGHPEQDRPITLREAAIIQSFPESYEFWPLNQTINRGAVSTMIGNSVPPALGRALGGAIVDHLKKARDHA